MGLNQLCPYAEQSQTCAMCVTCHATDPPTQSPERRVCQRTRQWPGCTRYSAAWKAGVPTYDKTKILSREEALAKDEEKPDGGIGVVSLKAGLPIEPDESVPPPPCPYLAWKDSSCKDCGGYICKLADDRRIMETMIDTCMKEPLECAIYSANLKKSE